MRKIYLLVSVVVFLILPALTRAQYASQQIDNSSGLSNSCINSIYQDPEHLIWFGTWDGLNYFDGTNIHVFNYERETRKNSIASNVIYQVAGDKHRNIWIGTVEGLSKFNKNTGDFSNYFYNKQKVVSNGYTIAINNQGKVYAGRRNSSDLYVYNEATDKFKKVSISGLHDYMLLKIFFDNQDNLWLLKDDGILEVFKVKGEQFVKQEHFISVNNVDNMFFCNQQTFYSTKGGELYKVSADLGKERVMTLPHELRSMSFYKNHYVLAWASKGIGEYDSNFKATIFLSNEIPILQNARVTSLLAADPNLMWFGTDGNGVIKVTKKETYFGVIQKQPNGQAFNIPVRAFCSVNGEMWIGTKGNGIVTIKNLGNNNAAFSTIKSFHTSVDLLDNCVYAIEKGKDGLVYIGSDAPGVTLYNLKGKKFIKWQDIRDSKRYPAFGSVHCVLYDRDSSVWLGLNEGGLVHLKIASDNNSLYVKYLYHYRYDGTAKGPGNDVIYSLARGEGDRLWIGCRYGGLSLLHINAGRFETFKASNYDGGLSNNDVLSVYIDSYKKLWVGTSFGLNCINEEEAGKSAKPVFKKMYVDNGLPNNTIHAIDQDNEGNMWVSTNKGLARINPQSNKIVQFKESDGLQSDEFSDNAVWKDPSGILFFGGIYGFNYFLPKNIAINTEQPHLLISGLQFAGKNNTERGLKVLTKNGSVSDQHYVLEPQDNYFELSIQPITYTHPQKCQYAYYLEGNDKSWHYMGNHEKIIYNNISPGDYTLKIKWSNGEGVWTSGITAFTITVEQYFWLKPAAFVVYILVLLVSGYLYFRYRKNKFMMQHELKMEVMLREKDEKLHQEQLNFFTNIAHELQTPLTLILGSLERYIYKNNPGEVKRENYFLSVVKQEASRLHYLVLQLLEFRKAESGYLRNHFSFINVSDLLSNISGLFEPLAQPKKLDFSCYIEPDVNLWMDKDKLEKIIFNLLSNAFKYTPAGKSVIFSVNKAEDGMLEIAVANSGCDLDKEELQRLFDRFFVAESKRKNKISSGIGLAFTRQLVNLLNGSIDVTCENGWIAFKVRLPLTLTPDKNEMTQDADEKHETPSYIFESIAANQSIVKQISPDENNKKALVRSFEQEDKKMILVVEDEQRIRYLLKDILQDQYIIYEAANGSEALNVIRRITPDLIISDIVMPDMDGLQLCNIIKNTAETCHIPFIILSARGTIEQKTEGYESGADAYIPKPFQTEHLLVRIYKLLEYRERLHGYFTTHRLPGNIREEDIQDSDKKFIEKIIKVIENNLDEDLDSAFLENALNLSRIQLYRKIKTLSNMTPTELIRHTRLQKASVLLLNSDLTVSEIFYRTGFNNKTYFFREFKKIYKLSPNDYRQIHRLPNLNKN